MATSPKEAVLAEKKKERLTVKKSVQTTSDRAAALALSWRPRCEGEMSAGEACAPAIGAMKVSGRRQHAM